MPVQKVSVLVDVHAKNEGYDCTELCSCQGTKDGCLNVRNLGTVINSEDEEENAN